MSAPPVPHSVLEGLHSQAAPESAMGREALLYTLVSIFLFLQVTTAQLLNALVNVKHTHIHTQRPNNHLYSQC